MTGTLERRLWWRHPMPALGSFLMAGLVIVGVLLIAAGLVLLVWTVTLFDRVGKGTLGLGDVMGEPVNLVIRGPYRHVRHPMITGVLCILLGEAAVTASGWLLLWFGIFFVFQGTVIPSWEEPHLTRRYGGEYVRYRQNVPRWIPRLSAWEPTRVTGR